MLPADTTAALRELDTDSSATPRSMPPSFYTHSSMVPVELDRLFLPGWICVGRTDEVPKIGDYYTLDILSEPLIVVRCRDASIAVLSNVCRHRGSQILSGKGNSRRFTCPYHRWSYTLDGELISAPLVDTSPGFDRSSCKLPSFKSAQWMGWLFVNLSGDASDLSDSIKGLNPYVRNYHTEEMHTVEVCTERWPLNWKMLAENFMEGYHLTPVHRTTLHPMTPTRLCEKIPGGRTFTGYKSHYSDSFSGRKPFHEDMTPEEKSLSMMVWIYPSFVAAISPNSAVYMSITPLSSRKLQTRWAVIAREELFVNGEAAERFEFAKSFNAEDRARLLDVQKGLKSRYAQRGYLAPPDFEGTVWDFYGYISKQLSV
ncbi:MAG: aromatic ring-hydroxylating dioxygenase subunit alpha [Granulosicoccus sp.]